MSNFIGAALPQTILRRNELRLFPNNGTALLLYEEWIDVFGVTTFRTPWWPGNRGFFGDQGADMSCLYPVQWSQPYLTQGSFGRFGVRGVTRDAYGSRLGGVTVKLFRTLDDSLQDSEVSDPEGNYLVTTPYTDAHYLYIYKAGPPEMYGGSANTLIPS